MKLLRVRVKSSLESEGDFARHRERFELKRKHDAMKRYALADYGGKGFTPPPKGGKFA